jgi:predicted dehydrogenase
VTRVLVVGLGSIGRRHLQNARALGAEVAACSRSAPDAFRNLDDAFAWGPDAVVVCTPTSDHLTTALAAVERGCHVLVEKPLSDRVEGLDRLVAATAASSVCLAVGYNLRFHPAVEATKDAVGSGALGRLAVASAEVGTYLPDWHPGEDYRSGYAASAELGGGALLTLSHELDLVRWIGGEVVWSRAVRARVSELELDADDAAVVTCAHEGGALSTVQMNMIDRSYHRRSRWVGSEATIEWIWGGPVRLLRGDRAELLWDDPGFDLAATYVAELEDFLAAAAEGREPRAGFADGVRVVELCAAAEELP